MEYRCAKNFYLFHTHWNIIRDMQVQLFFNCVDNQSSIWEIYLAYVVICSKFKIFLFDKALSCGVRIFTDRLCRHQIVTLLLEAKFFKSVVHFVLLTTKNYRTFHRIDLP